MTTRRLLRGGLVADGVGATTMPADVLIEDDRILILAVEPDLGHVDAAGEAPGRPRQLGDIPEFPGGELDRIRVSAAGEG